MSDEAEYCQVEGCIDPENPDFARPAFRNGLCSTHKKQQQRTGTTKPIAEKVSAEERVINAGTALLEAETDEQYESRKRALLQAAVGFGRKESIDAMRRAFDRARAQGRQIGRPPKVSTEELRRVFDVVKSVTATARVLRLSKSNVSERLARAGVRKGDVTERKQSTPHRKIA